MAALLCQCEEVVQCRNVLDDLAGFRSDSDVSKVWILVFVLVPVVGHVNKRLHHPGDIVLCVFREFVEGAYLGDVFTPARYCFVDRLECAAVIVVTWDVVDYVAIGIFVSDADLQVALPVSGVGEGIEFVEYEVLIAAIAECIALFHGVVPADHALSPCGRSELDLAQLDAERMFEVHLGDEHVRADFGIVGLTTADIVDSLCRNTGGLEEFRRKGMRCSDIGWEAMALVEPVSLAEFADDVVALVLLAENKFADIGYLWGEDLTCFPVGVDECLDLQGEWFVASELSEVEFAGVKFAAVDDFAVCSGFSAGQCFKECGPAFRCDLANVFDDAECTVDATTHFFRHRPPCCRGSRRSRSETDRPRRGRLG